MVAGGGAAVTVTVDKRRSRRLAGVAVIAINRDQRERAREKERQLLDLRELHSLVNVCMPVCLCVCYALAHCPLISGTHTQLFLRRPLGQRNFVVNCVVV